MDDKVPCVAPEVEMGGGINLCAETFGEAVMMAIRPKSVCMVGGPGTGYCLMGRCREILEHKSSFGGEVVQPDTIVSIDFYKGGDERTEVCRRMLAQWQARKRAGL